MTKDESTVAGMSAIENGIKSALDTAFDNGVASVPAATPATGDGTTSGISAEQEKADIAAAVADLQAKFDDVSGKLKVDDEAVAALQSKLDAIKALL